MKTYGKYEVIESLGVGAYAEVYKAMDTILRRTVALKLLKPALISDNESVARFLQEAQTGANLIHPHIAWVWDLGEIEGRYYLAMRFVEGQSLDQILKTRGALPWNEVLKIITDVGEALTFAHGRGLVHRDIKPQNIMISPTEGAVLTDFGLVRAMEAGSIGTRTGALMGTPAYMAPEIWQGEPAGPAADQYSLACTLVEMFTGSPLFGGPTPPAVMRQHLLVGPHLPELWPADCPAALPEIFHQALAQAPQERYPDIAAFVTALLAASELKPEKALGQSEVLPVVSEGLVTPVVPMPHTVAEIQPESPGADIFPVKIPTQDVFHETISAEEPLRVAVQNTSSTPAQTPLSQSFPTPLVVNSSPSRIERHSKFPTWLLILLALGGLGLMAVCVLGVVWALDWLSPLQVNPIGVVSPTDTPSPAPTATATFFPTTTVKPTTRPTKSPTATATAVILPVCSKIGQTWVSPVDGMTLLCVPESVFEMGTDYYKAPEEEMPAHDVYLDAYWIDQTEITNQMFAEFANATSYITLAEKEGWGSRFDSWSNIVRVDDLSWRRPDDPDYTGRIESEYPDYPVTQIALSDAQAYCEWAGRSVPTEAQWEKAARGSEGRTYPWGDDPINCDRANYYECENGSVMIGAWHEVGSSPAGASPYGALDMLGNVAEWTSDRFGLTYYQYSPDKNPTGPTSGREYVARGGSWFNWRYMLSTTARASILPSHRTYSLGFRCVLNP